MLISKKIWLLVTIAMATCAVIAGFGLYGLKSVNANMVEIAGDSVPALLRVSDMRASYLAMIPMVYERATTTDEEKGSAIDKLIATGNQNLIKQVVDYSERTKDDDEKKVLDVAKMGMVSFISRLNQVSVLAATGEMELTLGVVQRDIGPLHQQLSRAFDDLVKLNTGKIGTVAALAETAFSRTLTITIVAAVLGVALIGAMGFLLGRSITRPLGSMQRAIIRTANDLDFTDTFKVRSNDEIGRTLHAYNGLLARLRTSFGEIQAASARMAAITAEVDKTSKEIAENSLTQSDASSGMAAAIEELTVSISMVATQAQDASHHTQASRDKADQGAEVILSTVSGIQSISESVREASSRIDALRNDSDSISSVANIIKEIADQTNLLALNAAIEAARAGEQGRGFAVVADEVRKLAERTSKSTQEISALLAQMQCSANKAVDTMAAVVREVDAGVENAQRAGNSIQAIKEGSNTVVGAVEEISEAVREQSAASASISQRIEQIAKMTERNTAAADSTSKAVHRMSDMSREIAEALTVYKV